MNAAKNRSSGNWRYTIGAGKNNGNSGLIKCDMVNARITSAYLPKGFDYEMYEAWREVPEIGGTLRRYKIPQSTPSRGCLRSHADDLSGPSRPGNRKFLRQCP
jgi:uncharacterized protein (UPF0128 family)